MRTTIPRLATILLLVLGFTAGGTARADDEAKPLSAAEQAFKDAWWAETGGGNLNEALALYEKAAAADGPAAVKAKALYRRAVIQQRIGKTQEAIQTLERLAKEHPGEAELQSDARARLEEWTAVDLRTGFPEWYRRFQYGPEFQAKILDLVLKLGGGQDQWSGAKQELLTIGEPAIPALRAHLGSRNGSLVTRVVDILMQMGEVPDQIVGNFSMWTWSKESWGLILDLPADRRAAIAARQVEPDSESDLTLQAVLQGPAACVEFLARLAPSPPDQGYSQTRRSMQSACLARVEAKGALAERIRALVSAGVPDATVWGTFASWLIQKGLVTRADVDAWAKLPWETAATARVQAARDARLFQPVEALQVLADVIAARPAIQTAGQYSWLLDALIGLLPDLPWPESRDEVARVLGPLWFDLNRWGPWSALPSDRQLEAFGRAFELAREPNLIGACADAWMKHGPRRPGGIETLFRWAREGASVNHRGRARSALFRLLGERDIDPAVDLLVEPETVDTELVYAWQQLFTESPQAAAIVESPVRMWRLLDRIAVVPPTEQPRAQELASALLLTILRERAAPTALFERWLEQPERFPSVVFGGKATDLTNALSRAGQLPAMRRAFRERWAAGTPAQRDGLLAGLGALDPRADPETLAFLREILSAKPPQVPERWRNDLIAHLPSLTLEDVLAFYDLTQPAQADAAAGWILGGSGTKNLPKLEATPEAFEALRLAFRPDGPRAAALADSFSNFESVQRPLLELLFAHSDDNARFRGMHLLITRSSPSDADLWVKALKDVKVNLRVEAAEHLDRVPTPETLKALVAALDDPHPDVRASALKSLDSVQKMEDLKARWREKVK